MSLDKMIRMNQLFSYYQMLLTDKQQDILSLYYEEDYSLAEIAEEYDISRQAVRDTIKRSEKLLEQYESTLHLLSRRQQREQWLNELEQSFDDRARAQMIINQLKAYDE